MIHAHVRVPHSTANPLRLLLRDEARTNSESRAEANMRSRVLEWHVNSFCNSRIASHQALQVRRSSAPPRNDREFPVLFARHGEIIRLIIRPHLHHRHKYLSLPHNLQRV